jgi:hypothetical protein
MTFIYIYIYLYIIIYYDINHHKPIIWASFLAHKDADFALALECIDLHPEFSGAFVRSHFGASVMGGSVPSSKYEENGRHPTDFIRFLENSSNLISN